MRAVPTIWIRRSVLLANALSLVVGLVLVVIAAFLSEQQIAATVLSLIGGAFVSAAVVTLVLGALAVRETVEQVDSALLRGLQDVLEPIRDPVFAGSLVAYRWDSYLACPLPDDEHPDYAYQNMRISYRVDTLPSILQLVCAASRDDRALEGFCAEDFIFRWLVDDDLDPTDPMIFRVGMVFVDNEQLKSRPASTTKVVGGTARHLTYDVPRRLRQTVGHTVEFQVLLRKFVGRETRLRIQAQLFRSVTDAEYRLSVDSGLKVTGLWPSAAEVSAIGVARGGSIEATYAAPFDKNAAIVHPRSHSSRAARSPSWSTATRPFRTGRRNLTERGQLFRQKKRARIAVSSVCRHWLRSVLATAGGEVALPPRPLSGYAGPVFVGGSCFLGWLSAEGVVPALRASATPGSTRSKSISCRTVGAWPCSQRSLTEDWRTPNASASSA